MTWMACSRTSKTPTSWACSTSRSEPTQSIPDQHSTPVRSPCASRGRFFIPIRRLRRMYAQSVTIGPEFFVKSFNDYRDKFWAFAREIMQNSLDCGSTAIDIKIIEVPDDDCTLVVVHNDGAPMTSEILVDKLLSLGSSGKDFQGAVGGFGK